MTALSRTLVVAVAGMLAGACSASDTQSVSSFITARNRLLCSLATTCCSPSVAAGSCEAYYATGQPLVVDADDAVQHGFATFDRARAESCLAELRKADCSTLQTRSELDPCALAKTTFGTIPLGGACSSPADDCAEGTFCHADSSSSGGAGHCATEAGSGESCADARCHFGLICNRALVCGAPLPDGAACDPTTPTDDCASQGCTSVCAASSPVYACPTSS